MFRVLLAAAAAATATTDSRLRLERTLPAPLTHGAGFSDGTYETRHSQQTNRSTIGEQARPSVTDTDTHRESSPEVVTT